jgi:hypothetical protein
MDENTLDKLITKGLEGFSKDLNAFALKCIADKSSPQVSDFGDCLERFSSKLVPDIFTQMVKTYDKAIKLNTMLENEIYKYESEFDQTRDKLKQCSEQLFETDESYNKIKKLSAKCKNYSGILLSNINRAMELHDHQRALSTKEQEENKRNALTELVTVSFTPLTESNFEELKSNIVAIRKKHLYNKDYEPWTYHRGNGY